MNSTPGAENQTRFSKPTRLIEQASKDPIRVIQEIFDGAFIEDLRDDLLPKWLRTALINEASVYSNTEHRTTLLQFFDQLLVFTEAMHVISKQHKKVNYGLREELEGGNGPVFLTDEQRSNPLQVVIEFRQTFSLEYVRRELWYFLEAGVTHSGDYPAGFAPGHALMAYDYLSCLTEAAYCLGD